MTPDFSVYNRIIVAFSGGKDSLACVLQLLELNAPKEKIQLWHHRVDGETDHHFMDWPVTEDYCRHIAIHLGLPLYFSQRDGGFLREMTRDRTPTAPVTFDLPGGEQKSVGGKGPEGTRMKFPQVSADLNVRWCSAYLKIDVARRVFANDPRFKTGKFLFITGERREESPNRAKYPEMEKHEGSSKKRDIDQWRPVIDFSEQDVWTLIRRHGIVPHPAYYLGWSRVSCALCIFGDKDQWASARQVLPEQFERVAQFEDQFNLTIQREKSVRQLADEGKVFPETETPKRHLATARDYRWRIWVPPDEWEMPPGAFRRGGGPT